MGLEIDKAELRARMQSLRDALDVTKKLSLDEQLNQKLKNLILELRPNVVHTYLPMGSEINFYPVIDFLLSQKIKVVCPKTLEKPNLKHLLLSSLYQLEDGKYGTKFPSGKDEYNGSNDLIIVPGLAFNKKNYRIGYGGGYYDNFLKSQPTALKLGLFYSFQLIENMPVEGHDMPLDVILIE